MSFVFLHYVSYAQNINYIRKVLLNIYLHQVNGVNGGGTVFVRLCVSVYACVSVHSGPVNETGLKQL